MQDERPLNLSVSIVCFNSSEIELRALISSLVTSVEKLRASYVVAQLPVFLIDNSENPQLSLEVFADFSGRLHAQEIELRLVQGHGNVGYGKGHNLILNRIESRYHLILNPDIQLDEDCLTEGITHLESNGDVVLASPFAQYENGVKQHLCKTYPSVLTFFVRGFLPQGLRALFSKRIAKYEMHGLTDRDASTDIPIVSGCFMLCRSDALIRAKGFDEAYFLYFEDFDLSLRMGEFGRLDYVPAMRIEHAGGHAARKGFSHLRMFMRSGFRFFNTHGWRFFRQAG